MCCQTPLPCFVQSLTLSLSWCCGDAAANQTQPVQFVTGSDGKPTAAILTGVGAQATFQNTDGQVAVVTNNSPGSVTIAIDSNGNPSIPSGADLTVVSNNPSIPSTSSSSSSSTAGWLLFSLMLCLVYILLALLPSQYLMTCYCGCSGSNSCFDLQAICNLWPICFACYRGK